MSDTGELIRSALGMICHQRPGRSFTWLWDPPWLCARCTGIYLALACGAVVIRMFRVRLRLGIVLAGLGCALALFGLEGVFGLREDLSPPGNWYRFVTGAVTGLFLSFGLFRAITTTKEGTR